MERIPQSGGSMAAEIHHDKASDDIYGEE